MFPCYCNVKTTSLRHPARGDSLKDYPAPAYSKVGQPWYEMIDLREVLCAEFSAGFFFNFGGNFGEFIQVFLKVLLLNMSL